MSKEIIAVYQDCVLCGDKGKRKVLELAKKGINIRKVGFTTPEGKELCRTAVFDHKVGYMPFFTDGERFAPTIDELLEKPAEKVEKKAKKPAKTTKKTKENTDGAISKD